MSDALRSAGEAVEIHDDHFAVDATDQTWLADVGAKSWVVLSKDDRIRRNPVEREALLAAGVAASCALSASTTCATPPPRS